MITMFPSVTLEVRKTPMAWHMLPGQQVSNEAFLHVLSRGGFEEHPDEITWDDYRLVINRFYPNRVRGVVCKRCLGSCRDGGHAACSRCDGNGLELED